VSVEDMACVELVELVTDYLEGALPPEERRRFDAHIAGCEGCTAYLEQFRETIRLAGVLREDDVSPEARATLLAAFAGWQRDRGR
jgi:anti-sigma factor RsiW